MGLHNLMILIWKWHKIKQIKLLYMYIHVSSSGVHLLLMTTTSSSSLNVSMTVAEEAKAWVAMSARKMALVSRILKWAWHCSMLVSVTASESCYTIIFSIKVWHSKSTGSSPDSSIWCKSLLPIKWNVIIYKTRLNVIFEAFLLSTNTPVA